jgi:hypothetical protein
MRVIDVSENPQGLRIPELGGNQDRRGRVKTGIQVRGGIVEGPREFIFSLE